MNLRSPGLYGRVFCLIDLIPAETSVGKMGDYAQDQQDELEALESIYSEEITILGESPHRFLLAT